MKFLETIYLGDRLCTGLYLDGITREVKFGIDLISRVRGREWNFYADEDVANGWLVIEGVLSFSLSPAGYLPNDWIELVSVEPMEGAMFKVIFSLGATVPGTLDIKEVIVEIVGSAACIEDANSVRIRD